MRSLCHCSISLSTGGESTRLAELTHWFVGAHLLPYSSQDCSQFKCFHSSFSCFPQLRPKSWVWIVPLSMEPSRSCAFWRCNAINLGQSSLTLHTDPTSATHHSFCKKVGIMVNSQYQGMLYLIEDLHFEIWICRCPFLVEGRKAICYGSRSSSFLGSSKGSSWFLVSRTKPSPQDALPKQLR